MILLAAAFLGLAILQIKYSIPDALVLVVISATYFRGWQTKKKGYEYAASILAVSFALIEILAFLAIYIDSLISGETGDLVVTPAMFGILTLPVVLKYRQNLKENPIKS